MQKDKEIHPSFIQEPESAQRHQCSPSILFSVAAEFDRTVAPESTGCDVTPHCAILDEPQARKTWPAR